MKTFEFLGIKNLGRLWLAYTELQGDLYTLGGTPNSGTYCP